MKKIYQQVMRVKMFITNHGNTSDKLAMDDVTNYIAELEDYRAYLDAYKTQVEKVRAALHVPEEIMQEPTNDPGYLTVEQRNRILDSLEKEPTHE